MPTKINYGGQQQPYVPSDGRYSGGKTAPKASYEDYASLFVKGQSKYDRSSPFYEERLGYASNSQISRANFETVAANQPFLDGRQIAFMPDFYELRQAGYEPVYGGVQKEEDYKLAFEKVKAKHAKGEEESQSRLDAFSNFGSSELKKLEARGFKGSASVKALSMRSLYKKEVEEARNELSSLGPHPSGYSKGQSVRSLKAKAEGKFPLSVASKILGVSPDRVKREFKTDGEWHHTGGGGLFNETDFYDLSALMGFAFDDDGMEGYEAGTEKLKSIYSPFSGFGRASE